MPSSAQYDANSAAVVGAQHVQLAAVLRLRSSLRVPDGVHSLSLAAEDHHPHVAGEVVDEQQGSVVLPERIKMPKRGVNWANSKFSFNDQILRIAQLTPCA